LIPIQKNINQVQQQSSQPLHIINQVNNINTGGVGLQGNKNYSHGSGTSITSLGSGLDSPTTHR
jgi:hypothetical protein